MNFSSCDTGTAEDLCFICLSPPRVPGYFVCWKHHTTVGEPSCDSFRRQCVPCMRKMLYLNEKNEKRPVCVKCPTCDATVNPRFLNAEKSYTKDFKMMNQDPKTDYTCFHEECAFKGTQRDLDRHLRTECPWRRIPCEGCGAWMRHMDLEVHITGCTMYMSCAVCETYIPRIAFTRHLAEVHEIEQCIYCSDFFPVSTIQSHRDVRCRNRPVLCEVLGCSKPFILRHEMLHHYHEHLIDAMNNLEKNVQHVKSIQELCVRVSTWARRAQDGEPPGLTPRTTD